MTYADCACSLPVDESSRRPSGDPPFLPAGARVERPHVRDARTVFTSDHVLDLVITPDRTVTLKDQEELALAVEQGVFSASAASVIEADAAAVAELVADWGPPFCDGWERFRPDPA